MNILAALIGFFTGSQKWHRENEIKKILKDEGEKKAEEQKLLTIKKSKVVKPKG